MRSDEALRKLDDIQQHKDSLTKNIKAAKIRLREREAVGFPGQSGAAGNGGHTSGVSRPTEAAVATSASRAESAMAVIRHNELDDAIIVCERELKRAADIVAAVLITEHHNAGNIDEPVCGNCGRVRRDNGKLHPKALEQGPVTNGPLDRAGRCAFCRAWFERYQCEPAKEILLWHLDHVGERVPYAMIREHHPAEFARYHSTVTPKRWTADGTGGVESFADSYGRASDA